MPILRWTLPMILTGVTLALVAWNRSTPSETIVLSEREVWLRPAGEDNTARSVGVMWQGNGASWIDCAMLAHAGFACDLDPSDSTAGEYYSSVLPREVFVCFELGGDVWESWIASEAARIADERTRGRYVDDRYVESLRTTGSRLVAFDVDRDAGELSERCPDDGRHLIAPGTLRLRIDTAPDTTPVVAGYLDVPLLRRVHVPLQLATRLPPFDAQRDARGQPFAIHVKYGRRFEPWIVGVDR